MLAGPPSEAVEARPRERRHLAWVLSLARWMKGWGERVLAEHAAAVAKAPVEPVGARVLSLPLREPAVVLLPVPLWPDRMEPVPPAPPDAASTPTRPEAPTPRLNTLRCIPSEGDVPEEEDDGAPRVPFGFDANDLLPPEPVAVVAPVVPLPLQAVTSFPRDPARELIVLLKESLATPAPPSVPWSEPVPPSLGEPADAEEMLRQCERLELGPTVE